MAAPPLIVPTLSPTGAIYFAAVGQDATVQDIITELSEMEEVVESLLGDLTADRWGVQKIRKPPSDGSAISDDELKEYGNGTLLSVYVAVDAHKVQDYSPVQSLSSPSSDQASLPRCNDISLHFL